MHSTSKNKIFFTRRVETPPLILPNKYSSRGALLIVLRGFITRCTVFSSCQRPTPPPYIYTRNLISMLSTGLRGVRIPSVSERLSHVNPVRGLRTGRTRTCIFCRRSRSPRALRSSPYSSTAHAIAVKSDGCVGWRVIAIRCAIFSPSVVRPIGDPPTFSSLTVKLNGGEGGEGI